MTIGESRVVVAIAQGGVSFVAKGCAGGGDAVLRLGDGDERRRWIAGRLGGTPRPTGRWRSRGTREGTVEFKMNLGMTLTFNNLL